MRTITYYKTSLYGNVVCWTKAAQPALDKPRDLRCIGQPYSVANQTKKMKSSKLINLTAVAVLAFAVVTPAMGRHNGFGSKTTTTSTQGNSGKPAKQNGNNGTTDTTTTTTGPRGALKNDKSTPNQTTTTTTCGPGNSKGC